MTFVSFTILAVIFWSCVFLLAHTYAFYPALLGILARGKRLSDDRFGADETLPEVVVLMAVYNEEAVLEATLKSILASDYPCEKMTLYIGSDGSTDRSDSIVKRFRETCPNLHLTVFGGRNGKIRIINQLASVASGELKNPDTALFVLCDANVVWSASLLRRLASHFKRPEVGLVGSAVRDKIRDHSGIGDEEEAYIGQENLIKYREGVLWGKVIGAFGACYALRVPLFSPVPEQYIVDDFFLTLRCLEQGKDAIVDLDAVCYESVSTDIDEEFRRKRRIATGNFQNFSHFWHFIQPWNSDFATFFAFWSHKGLRWCGPFFLAAAFLSCTLLAVMQAFYLLPLAAWLATFLVAGIDKVMSHRAGGAHMKLFRFVRYFYSMNTALFLGFIAFMKGPRNSIWEPTKREGGVERLSNAPAAPSRKQAGAAPAGGRR